MKRIIGITLALVVFAAAFAGCSSGGKTAQKTEPGAPERGELVMVDVGWDSIRINNAIAGYIAKTAYGYESYREVSATTSVAAEALVKGEIDVHMECWTDNIATYYKDLADDKFKELGINFDDNIQGIYVPRYVIEGDPERGIEAVAPDLKTVQDLKKYKDIFPDDEDSSKGRIYGAIPGWEIDNIMYKKFMAYGLDQDFIYFRPGSQPALDAALSSAYDKGKPVVGYYWEPTWLMGKYDFVLLEDVPYDEALFKEGKSACPSIKVTVSASNKFYEKDPEFCGFLSNYKTSSALISEALSHMQDTKEDVETTAKWFLTEHQDLIDKWLDADKAAIVKESLGVNGENSSSLSSFPFKLPIDVTNIDTAVRNFSARHEVFFSKVTGGLNGLIGGIQAILNIIPWWLLLIGVVVSGWKIGGKLRSGIVYGILLTFVGLFGLWDLMNETLSIVIASVIISLVLGFPIGILIAGSEKADQVMRPILDTMQTMPVFVYLIPALLFFGLGKAPAVVATTIYAIVPVIRLTSHGIRQVDQEVVEAARSFGSTRIQALWKVQIPQALPTIMTGVNQTLMMAMAMVVTCSMIGANGLGMEVLIGVNRLEIGRGIVSGTAVVIIAIILDRITQGLIKDKGEVKK